MEKETEDAILESSNEVVEAPTAEPFDPADDERSREEKRAVIQALIFASGEPLGIDRIGEVAKIAVEEIEEIAAEIQAEFAGEGSGLELIKVSGKYQFRTKAELAPYLQELKAGRPRRLSAPALETLAVIAYRQPVVKSDIEKIRGVDVTPTLKTLLERDLIKIVGHQATPGSPTLYGTTDDFLKIFGLDSLGELPTLRDMTELQGDPGEIGEEAEDIEPVEAEEEATHSHVDA